MDLEIKQTRNYGLFSHLYYNRKLDGRNISKLKNETIKRNQMHLFPIIVDPLMQIIDGQHRFAVCKELSLPVFYIIDTQETSSVEAIRSKNVAGKQHNSKDKIIMLAKSGYQPAIDAIRVFERYNGVFDLPLIAKGLHFFSDGGGTSHLANVLDERVLANKYERELCELLDCIIESNIESFNKSSFVLTLMRFSRTFEVSTRELIRCLSRDNYSAKGVVKKVLWADFIESYNFKRRTGRIEMGVK